MSIVGAAREPGYFAPGFDCLGALTAAQARAFRADGFVWVGRYVETLTPAERDVLFAADLAIALIMEAAAGPMSAAEGRARGQQTVARARALGAPPTVHVTMDDEGTTGAVADVEAAFTACGAELVAGGQGSCLYVGAPQALTAAQLWSLPSVHLYWCAASLGLPEPERCGFAVRQLGELDQEIHGTRVDIDWAAKDAMGRGLVLWWGK